LEYGEITLLGADRDDPGNCWIIRLSLRFGAIGVMRPEVRVPMSKSHHDEQKLSMAEAADEAHRVVARDLLLFVRSNADWLAPQTKERLIQAFPRKPGEPAGDPPASDGPSAQ
jgi:hypothetical protein